jgi:hypothetical protein
MSMFLNSAVSIFGFSDKIVGVASSWKNSEPFGRIFKISIDSYISTW